jgi:hypothetical protein
VFARRLESALRAALVSDHNLALKFDPSVFKAVKTFLLELPPYGFLDHFLRILGPNIIIPVHLHSFYQLCVLLHVILQILFLGERLDLFLAFKWTLWTSMFTFGCRRSTLFFRVVWLVLTTCVADFACSFSIQN